MSLDEAMQWLAMRRGNVQLVKRNARHDFYEVVVNSHRSEIAAIEHHGRIDPPTDDPAFHAIFVRLVETVKHQLES